MATTTITALTTASGIDATADWIPIDRASLVTTQKINRNTFLGITGSPLGTSDTQNVTNKTLDNTNTVTLKDTLFTLQDDGDTTKQAKFQLSGITTATTRTYTLPNASSTLVDLSTSQTLTNKTLTSPTISGGTIDNSTVTVDAIAGHTVATTGTIYGISVATGVITTANSVSGTALTNTSVTSSKLNTGAATATVAASETSTSTSYVALSTAQAVTVTVGVNGLLLVTVGSAVVSNNTSNAFSFMSFALSGANTLASADNVSHHFQAYTANAEGTANRTVLLTGLIAGSTTVTAQFKVATGGGGSGTGTWINRNLVAIPL